MSDSDFDGLILEACDSFIKNIGKYNWALLYESDFTSAIYAELIKAMDRRQYIDYPIWTEYAYGNNKADIALGPEKEIAIEIKFAYPDFASLRKSDLIQAKRQLLKYIEKGAKKAYLICLEHQILPSMIPLSKVLDMKDLGMSGEWKAINNQEVAGDQLLIASITV